MIRFLRIVLKIVAVAAICIIAARFFFPLPSLEGRSGTQAIAGTIETGLGQEILPLMAENAGTSGVLPLQKGPDAFASRVLLAKAAEHSIDVQYYIWQKDVTGLLLLDALREAAERGVRVRLLVDDNGTPDLDPELVALNALPNMEVRLFNPFVLRSPRVVSYLFDFPRLNRRMHNKSFTVDGVVTIVGGRNIGDIYFERGSDTHYFDLDVIAVGEAAVNVSTDFDGYWSSGSAYPVDLLIEDRGDGLSLLAQGVAEAHAVADADIYEQAIRESKLVQALTDGSLPLEWVPMTLVSDDPAKGLGRVAKDQLMIARLGAILGEPTSRIDLISAYFIPGNDLTEFLAGHARNGIQVRTLTNSQEATDVLPVHSGYVKYRDDLLEAGVGVFELKSDQEQPKVSGQFGILGSSSTSLHAKTFTIDNERAFIGSFNFDPRSALLNCEMGFLIESPLIATEMTTRFDERLAVAAYQVSRAEDGNTEWVENKTDGSQIRYDVEPKTTAFSRGLVTVIGWLPIMWML